MVLQPSYVYYTENRILLLMLLPAMLPPSSILLTVEMLELSCILLLLSLHNDFHRIIRQMILRNKIVSVKLEGSSSRDVP